MRLHKLETEQRIDRPVAEVFEFFSRAGNLEQITPPWLSFSIVGPEPDPVVDGTEINYRLKVHGVPMRWVSRIERVVPGREFTDRQLSGPYAVWVHHHQFEPDGDGTIIRDTVRYRLPFGIVGAVAHLAFVQHDLNRIFRFRHQAVERYLGSGGSSGA